MVGLTRGTTAAHIARAALESIAYQCTDLVQLMEADSGIRLSAMRVDGGAAANDMLMQMQADLVAEPVVRPLVLETTALGAAYLAGLAVGFWSDLDELGTQWQEDRTFASGMSEETRSERTRMWRRALDRSRLWLDPDAEA
jgi:glycerol kinase